MSPIPFGAAPGWSKFAVPPGVPRGFAYRPPRDVFAARVAGGCADPFALPFLGAEPGDGHERESIHEQNGREPGMEALRRSQVALAEELETRMIRDRYKLLSLRERQVMDLVVSGLLNKQVGGALGISEITVKAHRARVMHKMNVGSLAELVKIAARLRGQGARSGSV
jgi:DNA-binding CsgD family transcriptional regulator